MITVKSIAAQGDVLFRRIPTLPGDVVEYPCPGRIVVAHSETGHHHAVYEPSVRYLESSPRDPLICYLSVDGDFADVLHLRSYDTHETLRLTHGVWEVRRQREWVIDRPRGEIVAD